MNHLLILTNYYGIHSPQNGIRTERLLERASTFGEHRVEGLTPAGDLHASPQTRLALARTYLRRGIELATSRARNER